MIVVHKPVIFLVEVLSLIHTQKISFSNSFCDGNFLLAVQETAIIVELFI